METKSTFDSSNVQDIVDLSPKMLSWAHLNFELQILVCDMDTVPCELNQKLKAIGYFEEDSHQLNQQNKEDNFSNDAFFSSSQTGKRIAAFALKESNLSKEKFEELEKSISIAYEDVKNTQGENPLLEKSYRHALETISIFKP